MPLDKDIKKKVIEKIEEYEKRINYLYLDSKGYVTIGVGHLVKDRNSMSSIVLCKTKNNVPYQLATIKEKQDEYDNVAKQPKNYKAAWYKQHTKLVMKKEDIDVLRNKDIDSFYKELTNIYKKSKGYHDNFDNLPKNVQLALFDMIYNLGANRIVNKFFNFDKAIKAGDWAKAANESNRSKIGTERNKYVKQLLLSIK